MDPDTVGKEQNAEGSVPPAGVLSEGGDAWIQICVQRIRKEMPGEGGRN